MNSQHILLTMLAVFIARNASAARLQETFTDYIVDNGRYSATISKNNGMLESLVLSGSTFEIASDYPHFSLFFPEFILERPDGQGGRAYHPSIDTENITTDVDISDRLIIVSASWINGKLNSRWAFFFEPDKPYFRVIINREVASDGVYSNFQQCSMYNPDMDNSFIINYHGQLELTAGEYTGVRPYVAPFREGVDYLVTIAQHSLWTVFDYGIPKYFPTIAWSDNESNIHAGIVVTYTSPNQRETISYHGGGFHRPHPGYAEAQFNWFGKSDSESLFLRKGTEFSMEFYFYQNYGSIDSLLNFSERLLSRYITSGWPQNYIAASWGGRTAPEDYYYWRYPQLSSNSINSQELLRHKGFAIPRSQNGIMDIHLFSLNLVNIVENQRTELTPMYGTTPLFDWINISESETCYTGSMSWAVKDFYTTLSYTAYTHQRHVTVAAEVQRSNEGSGENFIELPLSSRTKELYVDGENRFFSFISPDPILDTVSIGLTNIAGVDTFFVRADTLLLRMIKAIDGRSEFRFDLYPITQKAFRSHLQMTEIENQPTRYYKAYFVNTMGNSGISYLPASEYFIFNDHRIDDVVTFDLYASCDFDSLLFEADMSRNSMAFISTSDQRSTREQLECYDGRYIIKYHFRANCYYQIEIRESDVTIRERYRKTDTNQFQLLSVSPNPFDGIVTIRFSLRTSDYIYYEIYNVTGEKIREFPQRYYFSGSHEIAIDLSDYASSIYFCRLTTSATKQVLKLVMMK